MSNLFKGVATQPRRFDDIDIKRMKALWSGNATLTNEQVRMKWDAAMDGLKPADFIKRFRHTMRDNQERVKMVCSIELESIETFEVDVLATLRALERAYLSN